MARRSFTVTISAPWEGGRKIRADAQQPQHPNALDLHHHPRYSDAPTSSPVGLTARFHFPLDAFTIAAIPAFTASGNDGQAATTA